jgi:hypothetical protein
MGKLYQATVQFKCWKQHVCAGCGSAFRYRFERTVSSTSATKEIAEKDAERAATLAIQADVDLQPCPACGLYQPDMVGTRRAFRHGLLAFLSFAVFLVLGVLVYFDVVAAHVFTWLAAGVAALFLPLHWLIGRWDPNQNLDSNREKAEASLRANQLELLRPGRPDEATGPVDCRPPGTYRLALGLMVVGVLLFAAPELMRLALGWPLNPDWSPTVVGLGEEATFTFPETVRSLKGKWHGDATVEVLNADELGLRDPGLRCTTAADHWGGSVGVSILENDDLASWRPWVRVYVPRSPDAGGKELRLRINLKARYPAGYEMLAFKYKDEEQTFSTTTTLRPAPAADASVTFRDVWWAGTVGGVLWVLITGFVLRRLQLDLRAKALPTIVVPIKDQERELPED